MSEGQASTDAARQDQSEAALPLLFQRGVVIRLQILATLVLVVLIGGLVSDTFRNSLEPVGFPLFAAVAYPYVLLIGWVVYQRQTLLYRLRQTPSAN